MDVRYTVGRNEYRRMTTEELRAAFLNTALCEAGKVKLMYCEVERGIAGFAVPTAAPLAMPAGIAKSVMTRQASGATICAARS